MFWVSLSIMTIYLTDFFVVAFTDPPECEQKKRMDCVDRFYFNLSLVNFIVLICIFFYLSVYLPYIARIDLPWDTHCPRMIPAACCVSAVGSLLALMAFWPKFGFLTPFILSSIGMGAMFSLHFIPCS